MGVGAGGGDGVEAGDGVAGDRLAPEDGDATALLGPADAEPEAPGDALPDATATDARGDAGSGAWSHATSRSEAARSKAARGLVMLVSLDSG